MDVPAVHPSRGTVGTAHGADAVRSNERLGPARAVSCFRFGMGAHLSHLQEVASIPSDKTPSPIYSNFGLEWSIWKCLCNAGEKRFRAILARGVEVVVALAAKCLDQDAHSFGVESKPFHYELVERLAFSLFLASR